MKHEVLYLNSNRTYVRVGDTWYDTNSELAPSIGQRFLTGLIEEVLGYNEYAETYPESKEEIYGYIADKTMSGGFIRRVIDGLVKYGVNPETPATGTKLEGEF